MKAFILAVVFNLLTAPVRIDRRQQHEATRSLLKTGDQFYTRKDKSRVSSAVPASQLAKLGGIVPYGYIHPRTVPVKIDWRQQQEETSALLKSGDQCIHT